MDSIKQRYYDKLASNLLFAGIIIFTIISFFNKPGLFETPYFREGKVAGFIVLALAGSFIIYHYYCIRKGKMWAKVFLAASFVLNLLFLILDFKGMMQNALTTPLKVVNYIVDNSLRAIAIFLVFRYKFVKEQP
jgi:hypothetical protein